MKKLFSLFLFVSCVYIQPSVKKIDLKKEEVSKKLIETNNFYSIKFVDYRNGYLVGNVFSIKIEKYSVETREFLRWDKFFSIKCNEIPQPSQGYRGWREDPNIDCVAENSHGYQTKREYFSSFLWGNLFILPIPYNTYKLISTILKSGKGKEENFIHTSMKTEEFEKPFTGKIKSSTGQTYTLDSEGTFKIKLKDFLNLKLNASPDFIDYDKKFDSQYFDVLPDGEIPKTRVSFTMDEEMKQKRIKDYRDLLNNFCSSYSKTELRLLYEQIWSIPQTDSKQKEKQNKMLETKEYHCAGLYFETKYPYKK